MVDAERSLAGYTATRTPCSHSATYLRKAKTIMTRITMTTTVPMPIYMGSSSQ
jgi:hypothetical protein